MTSTPRRSGRPSGISSIGLTGAPAAAAPIAAVPAPAAEPGTEAASKRREPASLRGHEASRSVPRFEAPSATASSTTSYTLRLHMADSAEVDLLRVRLRGETGRRSLDQAAILRVLLRLAIDDETVRATLIRELTTS